MEYNKIVDIKDIPDIAKRGAKSLKYKELEDAVLNLPDGKAIEIDKKTYASLTANGGKYYKGIKAIQRSSRYFALRNGGV